MDIKLQSELNFSKYIGLYEKLTGATINPSYNLNAVHDYWVKKPLEEQNKDISNLEKQLS